MFWGMLKDFRVDREMSWAGDAVERKLVDGERAGQRYSPDFERAALWGGCKR